MSERPSDHEASMCLSKERHSSQHKAALAMKHFRKKGLNVYSCCYCQGWHVGRKTHGKSNKRARRQPRLQEEA